MNGRSGSTTATGPVCSAPGRVTVRRVVTTRAGGVSQPPYDSFNLGDHVGDDPAAVAANRRRLAEGIGLPPASLVWMEQIHSRNVSVVDGPVAEAVPATDAMVTATPGLALVVLTADCVPVLLADDEAGVVAAVHAGRVGARIGIVGEIYVKFSPIASNDIVRSIEANGGEAETSGMLDFFLYGLLDSHFQWKHLDGTFSDNLKDTFGRYLLEWYRRPLEKAVKISKRFHEITNITRLAKRAARFLSLGNRAGEGWFLTADMTDLLHHGCRGIICLQPFGCLPNHITGEGMIHKLHMAYPEAVFLPLDCDASASEANQENRLKLMMNSLTEKETHEKTLPFIRNTISARKGKVL